MEKVNYFFMFLTGILLSSCTLVEDSNDLLISYLNFKKYDEEGLAKNFVDLTSLEKQYHKEEISYVLEMHGYPKHGVIIIANIDGRDSKPLVVSLDDNFYCATFKETMILDVFKANQMSKRSGHLKKLASQAPKNKQPILMFQISDARKEALALRHYGKCYGFMGKDNEDKRKIFCEKSDDVLTFCFVTNLGNNFYYSCDLNEFKKFDKFYISFGWSPRYSASIMGVTQTKERGSFYDVRNFRMLYVNKKGVVKEGNSL